MGQAIWYGTIIKLESTMTFDKPQNYYEVLGLSPDASDVDIRKAYIKLARKYHPDHNNNQEDRRMIELNQIWDVLSHPDKKREYDARFGLVTQHDFTRTTQTTPKTEKKEEQPQVQERAYAIKDKRPLLKKMELALTVLLIILLGYIVLYLVINILAINMELPAWILKLAPQYR